MPNATWFWGWLGWLGYSYMYYRYIYICMIHINVFIRIWNIMLSFHRNLFFLTNVCYMPFKLPEILGCFPCNL